MASRIYPDPDYVLGPAEKRFFGSGFRRVDHEIRDLSISPATEPGAGCRAVGVAAYPADWSVKADGAAATPHLSSIDAVVFAASLAEAHMCVAYDFDHSQRSRIWLTRLEIRAGGRPHLDLTEIPITATLKQPPQLVPGDDMDSEYHCQVGTLTVRCVFRHPRARSTARAAPATPGIDDVLGPWPQRVYGGAFKRCRQRFDQIAIEDETLLTSSRLRVSADPVTTLVGAEAAYAPSVSVIDAIVAVAQLTQLMLYEIDRFNRADSNTMWMRRIKIAAREPRRMAGPHFTTSVAVTSNRLLERGAMGRWRTVDAYAADFSGLSIEGSVAHRLPVASAPAEATTAAPRKKLSHPLSQQRS